ncbi:MAG: class I SAM-dependent RNA methyltransferase [Microthrixaceae bacterium]|nr:class I SAM-dependent RNA methyltransferase [Microthrixaceae bacterium]
MEQIELRVERPVAGGLGLARREDGRVVLVDGGLPGERVVVDLVEDQRTTFGEVVEVLEANPQRVEVPHCPHVADGCGGCDHADAQPPLLRSMKAEVLADAMRRLGKIDAPEITAGPDLPTENFRTTLRLGVTDGRAGLFEVGTNDLVPLAVCVVAHPRLERIVTEGDFGDATEVMVRIGEATGEALVLVTPNSQGVVVPGPLDGETEARIIGADELEEHRAWIHEEVAGRRFRVSARSFFQTRRDGAEALVSLVADGLGTLSPGERLVDLYAGVGLFGAVLADRTPGLKVTAVESARSSVADAKVNLSDAAEAGEARVIASQVGKWRPSKAEVLVADPPRAGLGKAGVDKVEATGARRVVLINCDAAAAGRDAGLLVRRGYTLESVTLVDMFPHTHHTESVSVFAL